MPRLSDIVAKYAGNGSTTDEAVKKPSRLDAIVSKHTKPAQPVQPAAIEQPVAQPAIQQPPAPVGPQLSPESLKQLEVYKGSMPVKYLQDGKIVERPRYDVEVENELRKQGLKQQLAANQAAREDYMRRVQEEEDRARGRVLPELIPAIVRAGAEGFARADEIGGMLPGNEDVGKFLANVYTMLPGVDIVEAGLSLADYGIGELGLAPGGPETEEEAAARGARGLSGLQNVLFRKLGKGSRLLAGKLGGGKVLQGIAEHGTQRGLQGYYSVQAARNEYDRVLAETGDKGLANDAALKTLARVALQFEAGKQIGVRTEAPTTAKVAKFVEPTGPKRAAEYKSPIEGGGREKVLEFTEAPVQAKRIAKAKADRVAEEDARASEGIKKALGEQDVAEAKELEARQTRETKREESRQKVVAEQEAADKAQSEKELADIRAESEKAFKAAEKNVEIDANTKKLQENIKTLETLAKDETLDPNQRDIAQKSANRIRERTRRLQDEKVSEKTLPAEEAKSLDAAAKAAGFEGAVKKPEAPTSLERIEQGIQSAKAANKKVKGAEAALKKAKSLVSNLEDPSEAIQKAESVLSKAGHLPSTDVKEQAPARPVVEIKSSAKEPASSKKKAIEAAFKNESVKAVFDRSTGEFQFNPKAKFVENSPKLGIKERLEGTKEGVVAHEQGHAAYDKIPQQAKIDWYDFWKKSDDKKRSVRNTGEVREDFADIYSAWKTDPDQAAKKYGDAVKVFQKHAADIEKAAQETQAGLSGLQAFQSTTPAPEAQASASPVSIPGPNTPAKYSEKAFKYVFEDTPVGRVTEKVFSGIRSGVERIAEKVTGKSTRKEIGKQLGAKGEEFLGKLDEAANARAGVEIAREVLEPLVRDPSISEAQHKRIRQAIENGTIDSLPTDLAKHARAIRDTTAELGRQMVENGLMSPESFHAWGERHFAHIYEKDAVSGLTKAVEKVKGLFKSGDVRPTSEEVNRLRKRTYKTIEEAQEAGKNPVDNLVSVTAKTIIDESNLIQKRNFLNWVSEQSEFVAPEGSAPDGWRQLRLPKGVSSRKAAFGNLADKMVHPDIAAEIEGSVTGPQESPLQFAAGMTKMWKVGKVVWSPGAHLRQGTGNAVFLYMDGVPVREVVPAVKDILNKSGYFNEFAKSDLIQSDYAAQFLSKASKKIKGTQDPFEVLGVLESAQSELPNILTASGLYRWEDIAARYTMYRHHRNAGMNHKQAVDHVNENFPNYANVPVKVRNLEKSALGVMFPAFSYEAIRIMGKHALSPRGLFRYGKLMAAKAIMDTMAQSALGYSDDDWKKMKEAGYVSGMDLMTGTESEGQPTVIGLKSAIPGSEILGPLDHVIRGNYGKGAKEFGENALDKLISHPLLRFIVKSQTGVEPFTDKEIFDPYDPAWSKGWALGVEAAKDVAPAPVTSIIQEIQNYFKAEKMGYKQKSLGDRALKVLGTGVRPLPDKPTARKILKSRREKEKQGEKSAEKSLKSVKEGWRKLWND